MALSKTPLGQSKTKDGKLKDTKADILIYSYSGAGKTYWAATAPRPLYVIAPDIVGHKSIPYETPGRVVRTTAEIGQDLLEFRKGGHGFKTLLVDGLPFVHDMFLNETGRYFYDEMGAKDADLLPIQGRTKILKQFASMLRAFVDLTQLENEKDRVHVIFTTLEDRAGEDAEVPFVVRPHYGTKTMNNTYTAIFSTVAYINPVGGMREDGTPNKDRKVLFTELKGIQARDKLGIFPDMAEPAPNLSDYLS